MIRKVWRRERETYAIRALALAHFAARQTGSLVFIDDVN